MIPLILLIICFLDNVLNSVFLLNAYANFFLEASAFPDIKENGNVLETFLKNNLNVSVFVNILLCLALRANLLTSELFVLIYVLIDWFSLY